MMKTLMPRSLMGRSLLILILPVILVQMVTAYVFFDRHWGRVVTALSAALGGEIAMVAAKLEETPDREEWIALQAIQNLDLDITYEPGATLREGNQIDADFGWESIVASVAVPELNKRIPYPFTLSLYFEDKWALLDVQLSSGVMKVSFPQRRLFSSSGYIYLLWVMGAALLLLLTAILFMRNQVRPIRKLAAAAERYGRGLDVKFFKPEGAREVRQAGKSFLNMRRRITRQVQQRTQMLAGVSHDLRTPLTRLKLQLSVTTKPEDIEAMRDDIHDMERMITGYLDFVRGEGDEAAVPLRLQDIIDKVAGQGVALDIQADVHMQGRPLALQRALQNIIGNAQGYSERVKLSLFMDEDERVHIVIEDDGPGIPETHHKEVFKPFFRMDESRNKNPGAEGSVGLGLPIAQDIVHAHGGRMWLERSEALGGLAVHIRMPV